ncbi:MAG: hypothetical protein CMJ46_14375 [Planctomyces sp.]|nr:hypothetical protein [Planctomyces sp.]
MDQWACANHVTLDFSRLGNPTDNAFIDSFNGRVRSEYLNEKEFHSIKDATAKIDPWRHDDNTQRPDSALGNLAPSEFASSGQVCDLLVFLAALLISRNLHEGRKKEIRQ